MMSLADIAGAANLGVRTGFANCSGGAGKAATCMFAGRIFGSGVTSLAGAASAFAGSCRSIAGARAFADADGRALARGR